MVESRIHQIVSKYFRKAGVDISERIDGQGYPKGLTKEEIPFMARIIAVADAFDAMIVRNHLDKHFVQTANIDLGVSPWNVGEGWEPIGSEDNPFYGTYNGDGYQISGLKIDRPDDTNVGLFGYISGRSVDSVVKKAVIQDVHLNDVQITSKYIVGSLVGYSNYNTEIIGCTAHDIDLQYSDDFYGLFGGLIGRSYGIVTNCHTSGTIAGATTTGGLVAALPAASA